MNEKPEKPNNDEEISQSKPTTESVPLNEKSISADSSKNSLIELVKCPTCPSFVRSDRLKKHIAKVHERIGVKKKAVKSKFGLSSSSRVRRCSGCGAIASSGDNMCFRCSR